MLFSTLVIPMLLLLGCSLSEPVSTISADAETKSLLLETTSPTVLPVNEVWRPGPSTTRWQWQLNDLPIDHSIEGDMYDKDLFDNDAATVAKLHAEGRTVICYVNAGGWEIWRPDAGQFPETDCRNKPLESAWRRNRNRI